MNTQKRYTFIVYRFCVLVKNPLNSIVYRKKVGTLFAYSSVC